MKIHRSVLEPKSQPTSSITLPSNPNDPSILKPHNLASSKQELCEDKSTPENFAFMIKKFSNRGSSSYGSSTDKTNPNQNSGDGKSFNSHKTNRVEMQPSSCQTGLICSLTESPSSISDFNRITSNNSSLLLSEAQFSLPSVLSSSQQETNLGSCQLSPRSESSCINFSIFQPNSSNVHLAPTPPASDLEEYPSSHHRPSSSFSPSYYSLSPPDLLSPPLSTTSTSESCHSPSDPRASTSPPYSNISQNICSYSSNEEQPVMQSYNNTDNEALMSIIPKSEPINQRIETDPNTITPPMQHNHTDHGTIINLSSTRQQVKQEPICSICSQLACSCNNQSKPQSYRYCPNLLGSYDSAELAENNNNKQPNFAKLMENSNKNIKESLMEETKEIISTATDEKKSGDISSVNKTDQPGPMQTFPKGHPCPLPADIPTLDSLSQTSPKLSTWRQTRIISEKLEQHLWTWRCACKKSGKRISKSLLQARAKWAFRKAGIVEFKASDGWYWKWLSKWRRKGEEIGITEQGELSHMEIQVLPPSPQGQSIKTEVKEEDLSGDTHSPSLAPCGGTVESPEIASDTFEVCSDCTCNASDQEANTEQHNSEEFLQIKQEPVGSIREYESQSSHVVDSTNESMNKTNYPANINEEDLKNQFAFKRIYAEKGCLFSDDSSPPAKVARKELYNICERNSKDWADMDLGEPVQHQHDVDIGMTFVPLEALDMHGTSECLEQLIPNRKIAVSDILPLTLTGNQVCLALDPTNSILPLSPIFIKTSGFGSLANVRGTESHFDGSLVTNNRPEKELFVTEYGNNTFLDNLDEITSLPNEFLNIESLSNWQGDIEDIDTEQLVNVLCENQTEVLIKSETINEVNQIGNTCNSPGIQNLKSRQGIYFEESHIARERIESSILPSLLNRPLDTCAANRSHPTELSSEADGQQHHKNIVQSLILNPGPLAHNQPLLSSEGQGLKSVPTTPNKAKDVVGHQSTIDSKPNQYLIHPCGHQCKRIKQSPQELHARAELKAHSESKARSCNKQQDEEKLGGKLGGQTGTSGTKQQLTVIAIHKKRGEESLNKFKEEVRKFAVDHTFKETAKKFGIHHSTVSGWVKESEKQDKCANFGDFFREKGDDKFIIWLRECRETGVQVSLGQVKTKVGEILASCGQQDVEKTCKWFLLWHNRREEKLYVEGMEDEDMKKETQNLAYPPAFKLEVALFAKKHSQYAAAKIFNVARRRIFDWMRQIPKLEELIAKGHMKKMTGRGPKNRDIDQALYTWYCERKGINSQFQNWSNCQF